MKRKFISVAEYNQLKAQADTLAALLEIAQSADNTTTNENVVERVQSAFENSGEDNSNADALATAQADLQTATEKVTSLEATILQLQAEIKTLKKVPGADPSNPASEGAAGEPTGEETDPLAEMFEGNSTEVLANLKTAGIL